jgi:hypothetical protein
VRLQEREIRRNFSRMRKMVGIRDHPSRDTIVGRDLTRFRQ